MFLLLEEDYEFARDIEIIKLLINNLSKYKCNIFSIGIILIQMILLL